MNNQVLELAKTFSLDKKEYKDKLMSMDVDQLRDCIENLLMINLTDPNFSSLAEAIPINMAGYKSHDDKHGYDGFIGESYDVAQKYVEQKPKKTSSKDSKLNGGGSFADYTIERLSKDKSKGEHLNLMISGFVNGELIYVYEVPHNFKPFMEHIETKTIDSISKGKRVLPTFSYTNYKDCKDIKLIYRRDNIDDYYDYMTGPFFQFVKLLK
jgi:hypothetical protein